jgi:hypothetical protein
VRTSRSATIAGRRCWTILSSASRNVDSFADAACSTSIIYTRGERRHCRRHEHDRCKSRRGAGAGPARRRMSSYPSAAVRYRIVRLVAASVAAEEWGLVVSEPKGSSSRSMLVGGATMSTPWRWPHVGEGEETELVFCTHALMMDRRGLVFGPCRAATSSSAPRLLRPVGTFCTNWLRTFWSPIIISLY